MIGRLVGLGLVLLLAAAGPQDKYTVDRSLTFGAVRVYVDSGDAPLAAWQVSLSAPGSGIKVVGVENGEHPAFGEAPWYDRQAVEGGRADRVIVGAFNTAGADKLPAGRTRVTTIHLCWPGDKAPAFQVVLDAAAGPDEKKLAAQVAWDRGSAK